MRSAQSTHQFMIGLRPPPLSKVRLVICIVSSAYWTGKWWWHVLCEKCCSVQSCGGHILSSSLLFHKLTSPPRNKTSIASKHKHSGLLRATSQWSQASQIVSTFRHTPIKSRLQKVIHIADHIIRDEWYLERALPEMTAARNNATVVLPPHVPLQIPPSLTHMTFLNYLKRF